MLYNNVINLLYTGPNIMLCTDLGPGPVHDNIVQDPMHACMVLNQFTIVFYKIYYDNIVLYSTE